jgi:transcriptional regulator with XRE-family HTH domain
MARSLRLCERFIPTVKSSLLRNGFPSQKILAEELGISQSTVNSFLNGKPVDYVNFLELCRVLGQEWRDIANLEAKPYEDATRKVRAKVLISQRSPNKNLAEQLQQALSGAGHHVFLTGENVPLEDYLKHSDYLLLLLSQATAASEMVIEEVQRAWELHNITPQKPAILPLCVDFPLYGHSSAVPLLSFDLLRLLQGIQPWQWRCAEDTSTLVSELLSLITEGRTSLNPNHKFAIQWNAITSHERREAPGTRHEEDSALSPLSFGPLLLNQPLPVAAPELPGGQVDLASRFYIERSPIESRCYETITQPGALIRIKAPRQMGKTSLMGRILHHAENQGSKTVALSFQLANKRVFSNSDTFLQWFCASVGQELGMLEQLGKCWQLAEIIGSNQCCKAYFDQYLLPELSTSLTLGLDEVDRVFESPEIADDFFGLLRALHEEAKRRDIWKKFRLVVVHSTEVYIPLDINKSPFNVGLPIELPEFTSEQVQELARRHGLVWNATEVEQLMALVGGHPYLVRVAMYAIARQDVTLGQLVQEAPTEMGIFSDHLRRHLWNLEKYPELMEAMREVVTASEGVRLRSEQAFKLNSMGLVKLEGNNCSPRCYLYYQYLCDRL